VGCGTYSESRGALCCSELSRITHTCPAGAGDKLELATADELALAVGWVEAMGACSLPEGARPTSIKALVDAVASASVTFVMSWGTFPLPAGTLDALSSCLVFATIKCLEILALSSLQDETELWAGTLRLTLSSDNVRPVVAVLRLWRSLASEKIIGLNSKAKVVRGGSNDASKAATRNAWQRFFFIKGGPKAWPFLEGARFTHEHFPLKGNGATAG